jgi:hypothetical protein
MTEEQLPLHKMSDEEIHELAYSLAQVLANKRAAQEEFKSVKKHWTEHINGLDAEIEDLSSILKEQEAARRSDA